MLTDGKIEHRDVHSTIHIYILKLAV
jgi:hypothetical protein